MAPFVICSYDIEAYSESGDFPDASKEEDPVIQIGMTFATAGGGGDDVERVLLCVGDCADIPDAEVECFEEEVEMIRRWAELLQERYDVLKSVTPSHRQLHHRSVRGATLETHPVVRVHGNPIHARGCALQLFVLR